MDDKAEGSRVEFAPPKSFNAPDNVEPGKDFDLVCSFQVKPDGKLCMTKLGDLDMPGYGSAKDEEKTEHKPDYGEYSKGIMNEMPQAMQSGGGGQNYQ